MAYSKWRYINLQLFGEGAGTGAGAGAGSAGAGEGGEGAVADSTGVNSPDAGEARLRELGVPESVLAKRANRRAKVPAAQTAAKPAVKESAEPVTQQDAAAEDPTPTEGTEQTEPTEKRMTWDEIMADPEYNKQMQATMQARLKSAKSAEESMAKLAPAMELLARKYGFNGDNIDADALAKAIADDDEYYEQKALELGVPVETAKRIDQTERENARIHAEQERTVEQQKIHDHIVSLERQGEALKKVFPTFDLATELRNPAFMRMTSPNVGVSVEDAYYAVHRKEIQTAAMQVTAQKTAQQMANAIRSGQARPVENGTSSQAPSNTSFNYANASREQREALKRQIREAAAHGKKLYPGQI